MKIAVIIPTLNRRILLRRALNSVLAQTYRPHEIIVVDDGSTDETDSLIQKEFPEVIYLYQSNQGVSAARNRGIQKAKASWLTFLDSDDEWLPEKLSRQVEAIRKNPDMKICHTNEIWIRNSQQVNPMKKHTKSGGWIFQKCLPLCLISPSTVMIHRTVFDELGLFDESLPVCEDYDMWLRMTARYPVLYIDDQLIVKYGGHEDQLSKKYWGLDRFRIRALEKILLTSKLDREDRLATKQMLAKKIAIYIEGAQKRGKMAEVHQYRRKWASLVK